MAYKTRRVRLVDLVVDSENPRIHDDRNVGVIAASLAEFGQVEPLVVQRSTQRIIAGHGRVAAMAGRGCTHAIVHEVDCDDATARRMAVALNRSAELAGWDADRFRAFVTECEQDGFDLDAIGFNDDEIQQLIDDIEVPEGSAGSPPPETPPEKTQLQILVICRSKREQAGLLERLAGEGFECRALVS